MTETPSPTQPVFGAGLKSKVVDLALASLFGFFTALGYSYWTVNDMKHQVDRLAEAEKKRSDLELKKADDDLQKAYKEGQMVQRLDTLIKEQEQMKQEQRNRK